MPWPHTAKRVISPTASHYFGDGRDLACKVNHSSRFIIITISVATDYQGCFLYALLIVFPKYIHKWLPVCAILG